MFPRKRFLRFIFVMSIKWRSGLNCKRCRFDNITTLLERSGALSGVGFGMSTFYCNDSFRRNWLTRTHLRILNWKGDQENDDYWTASGLITSAYKFIQISMSLATLIQRTMCFNRLSGELNSRSNPPHPLDISLENGVRQFQSRVIIKGSSSHSSWLTLPH